MAAGRVTSFLRHFLRHFVEVSRYLAVSVLCSLLFSVYLFYV